jgi:peptide/nickel transport system substrate-binding protein
MRTRTLARARGVTDVTARQAVYKQLVDVYLTDRPHIIMYHARWLWALTDKVSGFTPTPDGMIRPQGITVAP